MWTLHIVDALFKEAVKIPDFNNSSLASDQHEIILLLSVCNHYIQLHGALEMLWKTHFQVYV